MKPGRKDPASSLSDAWIDAPTSTSAGSWSGQWVAGPDSGASFALAAGTHIVGRAPQAHVICADSMLERFHAEIVIDADGGCAVTQLSGRTPMRHDLLPHGRGVTLGLGASELLIEPPAAAESRNLVARNTPGQPEGWVTVRRTPRSRPSYDPVPIDASGLDNSHDVTSAMGDGEVGQAAAALVPTAVTLVAATVMATVLGQAMFALFAAMAACATMTAWAVGAVTRRRARRRTHAARIESLDRFAAAVDGQRENWIEFVLTDTSTLAKALADSTDPALLWRRRPHHGDAFSASLGLGSLPWAPIVKPSDLAVAAPLGEVDRLPVGVGVGPGARVALCGEHRLAIARALLVQLSIQTGPADWQLVIASSSPDTWRWAAALPHLLHAPASESEVHTASWVFDDAALVELVRDQATVADRHLIIVTDDATQLTTRTGALRRLLAVVPDAALLAATSSTAPAICTAVVTSTVEGLGRYAAEAESDRRPVQFRAAGISESRAAAVSATLEHRLDPEDPRAAESLPAAVSVTELLRGLGIDAHASNSIAAAWRAVSVDAAPSSPIGQARDGMVEIDLERDGPHALMAGTTGAGKSELLRSLVVGMSVRLPPSHLAFVLVDYKGGATFDRCAGLPHVAGVVTDLEAGLADRALRSLRAELTRREGVLRDLGAADLVTARRAAYRPVLPRLVVVVDEFAALATEHSDFLHSLVGIAQRGRSLGVHLILATQRPSGVISDDIRANTNLRLALRVHDASDAIDVVGDPAPALISRAMPGRAVMRLGPRELVSFQTAMVSDIDRIVGAICDAADTLELPRARPVWLQPLPTTLECHEVPPGALGLIDRTDDQAMAPLCWAPDDGHLLVVGATGSGVSSTLAAAACADLVDDELVVIDAHRDARWDVVAHHPRCCGVVRLHERERLHRLLLRAVREPGRLRVVIDGVAALRAELEPFELAGEQVLLDRLLSEPRPEVTLLVGATGSAGLPPSLIARCANRWVMHLHDDHDAATFGVPRSIAAPNVPGRLVVAGEANQAQVARPRRMRSVSIGCDMAVAPRLRTLPAELFDPGLPASTVIDETWRAVLGESFDSLLPWVIEVPDGDHILVVGPARSGRSGALLRLRRTFEDAHGADALAATVTPRRSPLSRTSPSLVDALHLVEVAQRDGRPIIVLIDDAELVADADERLEGLISSRVPGVVVAAAGRPDALRQSYGHWTTALRQSRLGLVMAGARDVDGDLLGATLPRQLPIMARPGLAFLVADGDCVLGQLATSAHRIGTATDTGIDASATETRRTG